MDFVVEMFAVAVFVAVFSLIEGGYSLWRSIHDSEARKLEKRTGLPVDFIDESGSSLRAGSLLRFRKKKERRDKGSVDRIAACLFLDQYLRENGCM